MVVERKSIKQAVRTDQTDPVGQSCGTSPGAVSDTATALAAFGTTDNFLARRVVFESNDGWCHSAGSNGTGVSNGGVLSLLWSEQHSWPLATQSRGLNFETFRVLDTSSLSELSLSSEFAAAISPSKWQPVSGSPAIEVAGTALDGRAVHTVSCEAECEMTILAADLAAYPSLAGQSVYMALRLRAATATTLQLEIADGSGAARATSNATLTAAGGWQTHRTLATLAWGGEARFGVRLGGSVEVATVAVAPIGTAWQM